MRNGIANTSVRTLFVSDVHLGSRYCQPEPLRKLIERLRPEQLYIVGDLCDGWLLRRRWRWCQEYAELIATINRQQASGVEVRYLLGNHDRCLQRWLCELGDFWIGEKCIHRCADGRRLLVIHGDQFDRTQTRFRRAANVSALLHERVLGSGRFANRFLAEMGVQQPRLATAVTLPIKSLAHSFGQLRIRAKQFARDQGCDGVVFGHTHSPRIREEDGFAFVNTGDWLEHCSAVVERKSGQMELWMAAGNRWLETCRRVALLPACSVESAA